MDDHSSDDTSKVLTEISERDPRVKSIRFSRNFGSHVAIRAGLEHVSGDCTVIIAADLQDPPEEIPRLLEKWEEGIKIVWAVREKREKVPLSTRVFSRLYNLIMRNLTEHKTLPISGADFWLMDAKAVQAFNEIPERHTSIIALVRWMGFTQDTILYVKKARLHGTSKWTMKRKMSTALNSFIASTIFPIRLMSYMGLIAASLGFLYALFLVFWAFLGNPPQGWTSIMVVVLIMGGFQMLMMGILGEYLWRTFEESRRRKRYIIEETLNL